MAVSFETEIRPLFTEDDIACMDGFGVLLENYAYMSDASPGGAFPDHANARAVYFRLTPEAGGRRMPKGGPFWSAEKLARYRKWMEDGFLP